MKQNIGIQIIGLLCLAGLAIFFNPFSASFESKVIFSGLIILIVLLFVIFDVYNEIKEIKIRINLSNEKFNLLERIKNLEDFRNKVENEIVK